MPAEPIPGKSFIEVQFPVSKISKESYKERKANHGQTLTGLGKWWGRKPLILARAALIGLLMPASLDPIKDRETFFKILTMDAEGMWQRKKRTIPENNLYPYLSPEELEKWFEKSSNIEQLHLKRNTSRDKKEELQRVVFSRMSYDDRLKYCSRPEEINGPSIYAWKEINNHLGTSATSLPDLTRELGQRRFTHFPSVGDCFCGGGSIPFEAARIGCNVFASDLSPVAALLTWSAIHLVGGGAKVVDTIHQLQERIYVDVNQQILEWGIEKNAQGWRADAYIYCTEVICPECKWKVPLAPSWVIGKKTKTIAILVPENDEKCYTIKISSNASLDALKKADMGTVEKSGLKCPNPNCSAHKVPISIDSIRHNRLRLWEQNDIIPRNEDVFQERLYCIKWVTPKGEKIFKAPDSDDLKREMKVLSIISEKFHEWQTKGYIPSSKIEPGEKTSEPIRTRGWTYWHHLFTPRQLLYHGLILEKMSDYSNEQKIPILLGLGRLCDWDSKLARWLNSPNHECGNQTFDNQALNTLYNYSSRSFHSIPSAWYLDLKSYDLITDSFVTTADSSSLKISQDIWITDPPYADAINYHELSEFFLAWYEPHIKQIFPNWYTDSKRVIAIKGTGKDFKRGMIETYRNLTMTMPNNGLQIVMFTHQNAAVWADLALILWASGLRVTAAWCIQTETESGLKTGNYVQGTVLLVLRKQTSNETAFLDEIYPEVESEVKMQLDSMLTLEDKDDLNFGDTDYQLAAYAAALRVLTKYKKIEEIDIEREISREKQNGEKSPLEIVIENAVKIACDHLVPQDIDSFLWKQLGPEERFYIKGLELESHGEYRTGAYQELARGFGLRNYRDMQESGRANETRLRTATEFRDRFLSDEGFGSSLVRQVLFAVRQTRQEYDTSAGKAWLRGLSNYWDRRKDIVGLLLYLSAVGSSDTMPQWHEDAKAARLLASAVEQDHV